MQKIYRSETITKYRKFTLAGLFLTLATLQLEAQTSMPDVLGGEPIAGFPGWRASSWYRNYNVDFLPWIYHDEHGWLWVDSGSTVEVIIIWDLGLGEWLFLNENTYRWMFLFGDNSGWIFTFDDNIPDRRFFQRFDNGSLFSVPPDLPVN